MAGRLDGKVAVITGAASGIGEAMAETFCREGAKVVAADISGKQDAVAKRIGKACRGFQVDVTKGTEIQKMLQFAQSEFGRLDILCNNAGIDGAMAPFEEYREEDFDQVWAVNGRAVFLGMRYAIPMMLKSGGGAIVNTASMAAMVAFPTMPAYCAAKGAVVMLTKVAAVEYARKGIRINAICPGSVVTGMTQHIGEEYMSKIRETTPSGQLGESAEIANLALFLASDESSFVHGSAIVIDGGYTSL